jgi:ubiquinol-cytochrome c reductase cytochrome b subunit
MFAAILILFSLPFTHPNTRRGFIFFPLNQVLFWSLVANCFLLTWIGGRPVEDPYIFIGQVFTLYYFFFFIISPIRMHWWNNTLNSNISY